MSSSLSALFNKKSMSILVSLPENRIDLAKAALEAGADGLKFHINVEHRASGNNFKSFDHYKETFKKIRSLYRGPLGLVLTDDISKVNKVSLKNIEECGFTYYSLYSKDITSKLLLQDDLEKTVAVDNLFSSFDVSSIENFNMKAIELSIINKEDYGTPLSFEDIISYQNYRNKTNLPIIIPSQKKLVEEDLEVLFNMKIESVMLGAVTIGTTVDSIYSTVSSFVKKVESLR